MTSSEFVKKLNSGLKGKAMCLTVDEAGTKKTMTITGVRIKNESNVIFDGDPFSVGLFTPVGVYSIVAGETKGGWHCGDLGLEVMIGDIPAGEAIRFVTSS